MLSCVCLSDQGGVPDGWSLQPGDCALEDPSVNPDATEVCDGLDNDCDGVTDEAVGEALECPEGYSRYYRDLDEDGAASQEHSECLCAPSGAYDVPASDEALARAWRLVDLPTDLDVARGSYTEFAEGGAQRLVRNPELRRAIHDYYYQVELNQKFDPWVVSAIEELTARSIDVGLAPAEPDVARIRAGFERGGDVLVSALRLLQVQSVVQADIGVFLAAEAESLLDALRDEISP